MENRKFEELIDLIINEQDDKARELFHEIVVEKSREIYESIMDEEMMGNDMEEGMHGQVGDLLDEIEAEETDSPAVHEDEEDIQFDDEAEEAGEDVTAELEMDHDDQKSELDELKDKLEDWLKDFEAALEGHEDEEMDASEEDMEDEESTEDMADEESEEMMEAVQLQKVSVTHGDDGANKKSVVAANSGAKGMDSKPVKFSGDSESVPTSPKGPSNEYSKKEGELPGAGKFKNVPGGKAKVDLASAPKPVTSQASGVNNKSPVAKG